MGGGKHRQSSFMNKIRILVLEDNCMLRKSITMMLKGQTDIHVIAPGGSGTLNLVNANRQDHPLVVLVEVSLEGFQESSAIESIRKKMPEAKVIGMGFAPVQSDVIQFVESGGSGLILKDATAGEILETIRLVARGEKVIPPSLTGLFFSHVVELALKKRKGKIPHAVWMTKREHEIVALISDGLSNKKIAQQLNIATHTVKSHVHNIMEKLALHTRLQIAKFIREEYP
ncbi:MAG: DNA-binding response regulator [Ignavibacteriae bacterium]|nr:MAG: DNA-binding response regulator [Ignavibacteriota bacterium]